VIRATLAALAVLVLAGCSANRFAIAESGFHALNGIDIAQSIDGISRGCYVEVDRLTSRALGSKPSEAEFALWGLAVSAVFHGINRLDWLEERPKLRAAFNVLAIGTRAYVVQRNHDIGIRLGQPNRDETCH
jgi:hypothetical protein